VIVKEVPITDFVVTKADGTCGVKANGRCGCGGGHIKADPMPLSPGMEQPPVPPEARTAPARGVSPVAKIKSVTPLARLCTPQFHAVTVSYDEDAAGGHVLR
jgi:hypothetical protein